MSIYIVERISTSWQRRRVNSPNNTVLTFVYEVWLAKVCAAFSPLLTSFPFCTIVLLLVFILQLEQPDHIADFLAKLSVYLPPDVHR